MNEEIILHMARPYVKDGSVTYNEFDKIFSILSRKEQYAVCDILFKNGINLVDAHIAEDVIVLDVGDGDDASGDFEILYDESLFKDKGSVGRYEELFVNKNIRQSNEVLCRLIQQGNRQATQDLCVKNSGLVDKYVEAYRKRYGHHLDIEDLEQVGFMGLIKAAQRFDVGQGSSFSTYAVHWIKQAISREIMSNGYAIRIPVHMIERINKVVALDNRLYGEEMPLLERISCIAESMELDEDKVKECLVLRNNYLSYVSLDIPVGEDQDALLVDFVPIEEEVSTEQLVLDKALHQELENVLLALTPKEREILKLRNGWDDNRPKTLEEIGARYNVTRERIRQIEGKALRKLRHPTHSRRIKDFLEE